ncbi:MAG: signal peptidase I [Clostridia bacterium]|nr:signal peptidase I [Clostridia bacterium]
MSGLKKALNVLLNVISVAIIVLAVIMLVTVLFTKPGQAPSIMGFSIFRVLSGSMEPTIPVNSMIMVKKVDPEAVKVGDVITFYSTDPSLNGAINTHRVIEITEESGELAFVTQGDANVVKDDYLTLSRNLIGKVIFKSRAIGFIVTLAANPVIFIPVIILPLVVLLVVNVVKTVRISKEMIKEEDAEEALPPGTEAEKARREAEEALAEAKRLKEEAEKLKAETEKKE